MIDISVGRLSFQLSPFERVSSEQGRLTEWINVFVEYRLPELTTQFSTTFMICELIELKKQLQSLYASLLGLKPHPDIFFHSGNHHLILHIKQVGHHEIASINIMMKPEKHADSIVIKDCFGIDQSYFPMLLSGLDEMINWPS
ncbi:WapI family immunity protein [Atlantibacter hermannii]|uniref:WapI family immunity protein n=1 Tax=Atlantibacter hermannii TaxID=565 RepID=UPI001931CC9F|nr:hypothetical protein [Atlantibacter hermannii]MBL7636478.1 hypothetical protein [Atlantibacter hermannii]MBL7675781.1 hypothetical protein [Atlantibacter hermannii]